MSRTRSIHPRPLRLHLDGKTPRQWLAGDPASTQLFNALSIVFPRGERMFVEAVRLHKDAVAGDPELRDAVRDFIAQEMNHGRAHTDFNDWLASLGLPVGEIDAELAVRMEQRKQLPAAQRLAATCALEHFTAIIAAALLGSPGLLEAMHEDVRPLWLWHAIEEIEHKSVAFDVYAAAGHGHRLRVVTMALATVTFLTRVTLRQRRLLRADGHLGDVRGRLRSAWKFFGPRGHFAGLLPLYLAYYRRDFHPSQHDDSALVERGRAELERLLSRPDAPLRAA